MTFIVVPGVGAVIGSLSVRHAAVVAPASQVGPPAATLLRADRTPLRITLGQWERAQGRVADKSPSVDAKLLDGQGVGARERATRVKIARRMLAASRFGRLEEVPRGTAGHGRWPGTGS